MQEDLKSSIGGMDTFYKQKMAENELYNPTVGYASIVSYLENNASFFVKHGNKYKKIEWKDVVFLNAGKNYISVFNAADSTVYYVRTSLHKMLNEILPLHIRRQFIQINRSDVVNSNFIREIVADEIKTQYCSFAISSRLSKSIWRQLNVL